jgi:hypothetical protein
MRVSTRKPTEPTKPHPGRRGGKRVEVPEGARVAEKAGAAPWAARRSTALARLRVELASPDAAQVEQTESARPERAERPKDGQWLGEFVESAAKRAQMLNERANTHGKAVRSMPAYTPGQANAAVQARRLADSAAPRAEQLRATAARLALDPSRDAAAFLHDFRDLIEMLDQVPAPSLDDFIAKLNDTATTYLPLAIKDANIDGLWTSLEERLRQGRLDIEQPERLEAALARVFGEGASELVASAVEASQAKHAIAKLAAGDFSSALEMFKADPRLGRHVGNVIQGLPPNERAQLAKALDNIQVLAAAMAGLAKSGDAGECTSLQQVNDVLAEISSAAYWDVDITARAKGGLVVARQNLPLYQALQANFPASIRLDEKFCGCVVACTQDAVRTRELARAAVAAGGDDKLLDMVQAAAYVAEKAATSAERAIGLDEAEGMAEIAAAALRVVQSDPASHNAREKFERLGEVLNARKLHWIAERQKKIEALDEQFSSLQLLADHGFGERFVRQLEEAVKAAARLHETDRFAKNRGKDLCKWMQKLFANKGGANAAKLKAEAEQSLKLLGVTPPAPSPVRKKFWQKLGAARGVQKRRLPPLPAIAPALVVLAAPNFSSDQITKAINDIIKTVPAGKDAPIHLKEELDRQIQSWKLRMSQEDIAMVCAAILWNLTQKVKQPNERWPVDVIREFVIEWLEAPGNVRADRLSAQQKSSIRQAGMAGLVDAKASR